MREVRDGYIIEGASFASGLAAGLPVFVSEAQNTTSRAYILIIRRRDSLKSIERVLAREPVVAAILEGFGPYSHQHWLCGYYDVPAISLDSENLGQIPNDYCMIDFDAAYVAKVANDRVPTQVLEPLVNRYVSVDSNRSPGNSIRIFAQINNPSDVDVALKQGCDGFGEIKSSLLDAQTDGPRNHAVEILRAITLFNADPEILPVRFFDASPRQAATKNLVDGTANSALGVRGVRLLSQDKSTVDLFQKSLKGIEDLDYTIVLPMVNSKVELEEAAQLLQVPMSRIGVQFETPMACLNASKLLPGLGFAIVGLNDLTQYTTAWDRNSFHAIFTPSASILPQVVSLAKKVCLAARQEGVPSAVAVDLFPTVELARNLRSISPDFIVVSPRRIRRWRSYLETG